MESAEIAVIGGTGVYSPEMLKNAVEVDMDTPYGKPSDDITVGDFAGKRVAFLFRHGKGHSIPPHRINFRANIYALKQLGVKRIIATAAVGSLQVNYKAGDVVIPDQFIDFGKHAHTFHDGEDGKLDTGVYHVSMADPFCPEVMALLADACKRLGVNFHPSGTYLRIEGPQFSTRAASRMYKQFADIIGMTCIPEAILARELEMCFGVVATITDYDVWADNPVNMQQIINVMKRNTENTKKIIELAVAKMSGERKCNCRDALKDAKA